MPCAKCIENRAEAKAVTVAKGQKETLARLLISLLIPARCRTSEQRTVG